MSTFEINAFCGNGSTPCKVFVYENSDASRWYICEGSTLANLTFDPIEEGTNVELIKDIDCFTWPKGVKSIDEFIEAVEY